MTLMDIAVLSTAALAAGVLNALAGGGSFLTFPALVFTGVPAIAANATSAVAVAPGYLGSTLGFKAELAALPQRRLWVEGAICAVGGALGAALLLNTPARVFSAVVPWLLLFATACFALGPRWLAARHARRPQVDAPSTSRLGQRAGLMLVAVYGGYFNGGLGILLMALYSVTGERDINTSNALKNLNSWVLSLLSVATFAAAGLVQWPQAALMMVATTAGGFWGARLARRWPPAVVRAIVITTGLVMAGVFFARQ